MARLPRKQKKYSVLLLKGGISLAFFGILFSFVQTHELFRYLQHPDWSFLIISLMLGPVLLLVSCWKWWIILEIQGYCIKFTTLVRIYCIGYFFSNLLPSMVGGDVARSFYVGRLIHDHSSAAVSVFIERVTGLILLLVLVVLAPMIRPSLYLNLFVLLPACGACVLLGVFWWFWQVHSPLTLPERLSRCIVRLLKGLSEFRYFAGIKPVALLAERMHEALFRKLAQFHRDLVAALSTIRRYPKHFVTIATLTGLFYFLTWLNVWIAFRTFGVHRGFWEISALVPTIMFVGQMPVTLLGNLGFFESVYVGYFLLLGIPPEGSLAMGLLMRLKILMLGCMGLCVYLLSRQDGTIPQE